MYIQQQQQQQQQQTTGFGASTTGHHKTSYTGLDQSKSILKITICFTTQLFTYYRANRGSGGG
jgi:hypothetical protein